MILLVVVLAAASVAAPVHFAASTTNMHAQAAIDRGLFFYYAYDGTDAKRAFAQAAAFDRTWRWLIGASRWLKGPA